MEVNLPGGVFVVANASEIESLEAACGAGGFAGAQLVALPADAPVPPDIVAAARVLVIEAEPSDRSSLRRIAQLREQRPGLPIIAALRQADVTLVRTLVRQGVADVAVLPFNRDELVSQILDAAAQRDEHPVHERLAPLVTVIRSAGGVGSTSVLTHLAAALAHADGGMRSVCVLDLDLQSGDAASYMGRGPKFPITELLESGERLDAELLRGSVTDSGRGFSILAAPDAITPLETVDADQLMRLLAIARREFDIVLADLPADWTGWALSAALASNEIVLVTSQSIGSLRQAKRRVELLTSVGYERRHIKVVVNRVERRLFKTIGVEEVRDALGCEVLATLSEEGPELGAAQDQGLLITEVNRKSKFGRDIETLANLLLRTEC